MVRVEKAAVVLMVPALAIALVRASGPSGPSYPVLCAFVALVAALGLWFMQLADEKSTGANIEGALALALFGIAPATVAALSSNPNPSVIASVSAMAIGLTILRWRPETPWHLWAALLPAALCIPLHRAGIVFVALAMADAWLRRIPGDDEPPILKSLFDLKPLFDLKSLLDCWPAILISVAAFFVHRAEPWALASVPQAALGALAYFCWPFDSAIATGWSVADGSIALLLLLAAGVASLIAFRLHAAAFGILWFLLAILAAPSAPLAAFPGLALALSSAIVAIAASGLRAAPSMENAPAELLAAQGGPNQDGA